MTQYVAYTVICVFAYIYFLTEKQQYILAYDAILYDMMLC